MKTLGTNRLAVLALAVAVVLTRSAPAWSAATDKRELRAREAYAAGQYKEALDLYVKLYAEKLHPTYLRNIGRCQQLLDEPDKAINSFREYLHKAKALAPAERAEVEGYIHDMEALKTRGGDKAPAPATATATFKPAPPAGGAAAPGAATAPAAQPPLEARRDVEAPASTAPVLIAQPAPAKEETSPAFYKRWWFWTAVGVVVAAGAIAAATGVFKKTQDAACDPARSCM
jgi:tetratricopeptide (TPR) repeat protein